MKYSRLYPGSSDLPHHISSLLVISGEPSETSHNPGRQQRFIKSFPFPVLVSVGGQVVQNDRKTLEGKGLSLENEFHSGWLLNIQKRGSDSSKINFNLNFLYWISQMSKICKEFSRLPFEAHINWICSVFRRKTSHFIEKREPWHRYRVVFFSCSL